METKYMVMGVVILFGGAIAGIFTTKTPGWGKYTTCLLVLVLCLFVGTLALSLGKLEAPQFANLLFAVAGYAGGLVTAKEQ
jgi:hypothetical protein